MEYNFIITVQFPDGTQKQFVTSNKPYRVGEFAHGGVIISCNNLVKIN